MIFRSQQLYIGGGSYEGSISGRSNSLKIGGSPLLGGERLASE
jgi:hypothetical protein